MAEYHGVVYTKKWVVSLILDIAGYTIDKKLWNSVVVEPSCGHGSFLDEIVKRLLESAKRDNMLDEAYLESCVRAFDLDEKSVYESRCIVRRNLICYGISENIAEKLSEKWVQNNDYLLFDDIPADYVIGNPPYLRATEIPSSARKKYVDKLSSMTKGCDVYVGFFEKGLRSLKNKNGVLCYICSDRWLQNQYGRKLRGFITEKYHIDTLVRMHGVDAFEVEVSAYPAIIRIDYGIGKLKYVDCIGSFTDANAENLKSWLRAVKDDYKSNSFSAVQLEQPKNDMIIPLSKPEIVKNIQKYMMELPTLEESGVKLGIGLATGKDDVFIVDRPDVAEPDRMLPMFNMRDWRRKGTTERNWLVNPWNRNGGLVSLADYPKLRTYYEKHKKDISARHVVKKNASGWYRTIDKVNWSILGTPMLLFPDMAMRSDPVYSDGTRYPCHNCYWLISDTWDIKVLGGLLMSDVAESFIDALGVKMRGGTKRFQAQYLRLIHVPIPDTISSDVARMLKEAFENNDRETANKAAAIAYKMR